jgi:hypothetical protein
MSSDKAEEFLSQFQPPAPDSQQQQAQQTQATDPSSGTQVLCLNLILYLDFKPTYFFRIFHQFVFVVEFNF